MDYLIKKRIPYNIKIDYYDSTFIKQLYELFINNIIEESIDPLYLRFCGLYYCVKKQYEKMKEIYLKSYTYDNTILYFYEYNIVPDWIFKLTNLTEIKIYYIYLILFLFEFFYFLIVLFLNLSLIIFYYLLFYCHRLDSYNLCFHHIFQMLFLFF